MNFVILTGGISTGKSTVCRILENEGCKIVDTDTISYDLVRKGKDAWHQIVKVFNTNLLRPDGELDRVKLGNIVFNNSLERKKLNGIMHPKIFKQLRKISNNLYRSSYKKIIVVEIPLFFELMKNPVNSNVILVYLTQELQIERLMKRNKYDRIDAIKRINSQVPIDEKQKFAKIIIDNTGSFEKTKSSTLLALKNIKLRGKFTKQKFDILIDRLI